MAPVSRPALSRPPRDNLIHPNAARFQVFTTGRSGLMLVLAGSECVVSVPIEAEIDASERGWQKFAVIVV